jgi:hypothetical protein
VIPGASPAQAHPAIQPSPPSSIHSFISFLHLFTYL